MKTLKKKPLGLWDHSIQMDLKEKGHEAANGIHNKVGDHWRGFDSQ
jgi:hypothetical protein